MTNHRANHWLYCFGIMENIWSNVKNHIFCNSNQANGTVRVGIKNDPIESESCA